MSYSPVDGVLNARVGDEDEVAPDCWDCFQCTRSVDLSGAVGDTVKCPGCGAEYEFTSEVRTVVRQYVKLTKPGEDEPRLRMVMPNPWGHGKIRF
jgi:hypothetical protein